jgi:hypothetical protein
VDEMNTFLDCSLLQRRLLIGKSMRAAKRMLESQGRSACYTVYKCSDARNPRVRKTGEILTAFWLFL